MVRIWELQHGTKATWPNSVDIFLQWQSTEFQVEKHLYFPFPAISPGPSQADARGSSRLLSSLHSMTCIYERVSKEYFLSMLSENSHPYFHTDLSYIFIHQSIGIFLNTLRNRLLCNCYCVSNQFRPISPELPSVDSWGVSSEQVWCCLLSGLLVTKQGGHSGQWTRYKARPECWSRAFPPPLCPALQLRAGRGGAVMRAAGGIRPWCIPAILTYDDVL